MWKEPSDQRGMERKVGKVKAKAVLILLGIIVVAAAIYGIFGSGDCPGWN